MDRSFQSKAILILVMPAVAASVILEVAPGLSTRPVATLLALLATALFGAVVYLLRAGDKWGSVCGALIAASLYFATRNELDPWWHSAIPPLILLVLLTGVGSKIGRKKKLEQGTAESAKGRSAVQVAANLGVAAIASAPAMQLYALNLEAVGGRHVDLIFAPALAAMAEVVADTLASEFGQLFPGKPRMITNFQAVEHGTDGALSIPGTLVGVAAAGLMAAVSVWSLGGGATMGWLIMAGAFVGFLVDSLLGATVERAGILRNDAVNFLSTVAAALVPLCWMLWV